MFRHALLSQRCGCVYDSGSMCKARGDAEAALEGCERYYQAFQFCGVGGTEVGKPRSPSFDNV